MRQYFKMQWDINLGASCFSWKIWEAANPAGRLKREPRALINGGRLCSDGCPTAHFLSGVVYFLYGSLAQLEFYSVCIAPQPPEKYSATQHIKMYKST